MISSKLWLVVRMSAIIGLAGLLIFFFIVLPGGQMRRAVASAGGAPDYQNGYPAGSATATEPAYPAGATSSPQATAGAHTPTAPSITEPAESPTPSVQPTETLTPTLVPNVFRTEDSEMGGAKTTPLSTETAGPTVTVYGTPTETKTPLPTRATQFVAQKKDNFTIDWGLFWIGFSLPILGGCGVVLYLLDRRPDIFKRLH